MSQNNQTPCPDLKLAMFHVKHKKNAAKNALFHMKQQQFTKKSGKTKHKMLLMCQSNRRTSKASIKNKGKWVKKRLYKPKKVKKRWKAKLMVCKVQKNGSIQSDTPSKRPKSAYKQECLNDQRRVQSGFGVAIAFFRLL